MKKKILFIENRYKTFLLEPIAKRLDKMGYEIFWIIQNKEFDVQGNFKKFIIPLPPKKKKTYAENKRVEDIIEVDRQYNFFNNTATDYFYYYNEKIDAILEEVQPDLVFGEATAFHELLAIINCEKRNILYLNPCTSRYPTGRFSFYRYNTMEPYMGSEEVLDEEVAVGVIEEIIHRKVMPDYMKKKKFSNKKKLKDKLLKLSSYFKGERYNTPHPYIKLKVERQKKKNIKYWDSISEKGIQKNNSFKLLYPMQMQPEANIDVWGSKHRDQAKLIDSISSLLQEDEVLYVKPNPKSKYELSKELIDLLHRKKNVHLLHHSVKMEEVLPDVDMVVTVTGTIAIECILMNKPVVTLVNSINNSAKNCIYMSSLDKELTNVIQDVKNESFAELDRLEKVHFINVLNKTSYKGNISDPFTDPSCIVKENIDNLVEAFNAVIETNE